MITLIMSLILYKLSLKQQNIISFITEYCSPQTLDKLVEYIRPIPIEDVEGNFGKLLQILMRRIDLENILFIENYGLNNDENYDFLPIDKLFITTKAKIALSFPFIPNPSQVSTLDGKILSRYTVDKDNELNQTTLINFFPEFHSIIDYFSVEYNNDFPPKQKSLMPVSSGFFGTALKLAGSAVSYTANTVKKTAGNLLPPKEYIVKTNRFSFTPIALGSAVMKITSHLGPLSTKEPFIVLEYDEIPIPSVHNGDNQYQQCINIMRRFEDRIFIKFTPIKSKNKSFLESILQKVGFTGTATNLSRVANFNIVDNLNSNRSVSTIEREIANINRQIKEIQLINSARQMTAKEKSNMNKRNTLLTRKQLLESELKTASRQVQAPQSSVVQNESLTNTNNTNKFHNAPQSTTELSIQNALTGD